VTHCRGKVVSV